MAAYSFLRVIKPIINNKLLSGNDKWTYAIKENGYTENKAVNGKRGL